MKGLTFLVETVSSSGEFPLDLAPFLPDGCRGVIGPVPLPTLDEVKKF
jgi:hypothetical protein